MQTATIDSSQYLKPPQESTKASRTRKARDFLKTPSPLSEVNLPLKE